MLSSTDYERLAATYAAARHPSTIFEAVAAVLRERIGFGLLTLLRLEPDGEQVTRLFTTDDRHYPVGGTEALGSTAWGDQVLRQGRPFLGADKAALRWAFPGDYALIESLGLGSAINIPITMLGRVLGSMNVLDRENCYDDRHLAAVYSLNPFLVPLAGESPASHETRRE